MPGAGDESGIWRQLTRGAPLAVFVASGLLLLYKLLPVLELVAVAMLLALVLRTIVRWFGKVGIPPWVAVLVLLGGLAGLGAVVVLAVIPNLVREAQMLASASPGYINSIAELSRQLHGSYHFVPDLSRGLGQLQVPLFRITDSLPLVLSSTANLTAAWIATLILALYMAYDSSSLIAGIMRLAPAERRGDLRGFIQALEVRLRFWIVGTGLAMLIIGGGAGIGLWILGIPLPLSFGLLAGLLEIIPYFGAILGAFLPILVALSISPVKALLVGGLFLALNQLDANIVQPLVVGRRVRVHPVVTIIAFLVLERLLGFVGLLLAVPAAVFMSVLLEGFAEGDFLEEPAQEKQSSPAPDSR